MPQKKNSIIFLEESAEKIIALRQKILNKLILKEPLFAFKRMDSDEFKLKIQCTAFLNNVHGNNYLHGNYYSTQAQKNARNAKAQTNVLAKSPFDASVYQDVL